MSDAVAQRLNALFGEEFAPLPVGENFSLAPMRAALAALGDPQNTIAPVLHVAGTNGKGSTCAFLRALGEAAGLRVHAFTKPHLLLTRERVRLAGALVSDARFIAAIERVAATGVALRHFEAQVAAAFVLFAETPADLVVLETGMGGLLDATNVIEAPALCVITPIDLDHVGALGDDLAAIARHKAGILKAGAPAIVARQERIAADVIAARAEEIGAPLLLHGRDWDAYAQGGRLVVQTETRLFDLPKPAMHGAHQIDNAGLAIVAMAHWRPALTEEACAHALAAVQAPARLARVATVEREVWIDGAHNAHGARALAQALGELNARAPRPLILIVGMRDRKDPAAFLAPLTPGAEAIIATPITDAACIAPTDLSAAAGARAEEAASLAEALARARALNTEARIVICGSLALAGEAYRLFGLSVD